MLRMSLAIRLIGTPRIEHHGTLATGPRGSKTWGVLAYLLLCRRPAARARLASLFFSTAADPLGALRWSLAELRRTLGRPLAFRGDPIRTALGPEVVVDIDLLGSADIDDRELEQLSGELLEGVRLDASPALQSWLLVERRRLTAAVDALLYERAQAHLAAGRTASAASLAGRLVDRDPFDASYSELLVRCLLAGGDGAGAAARVEVYETLVTRELRATPSLRLRALLRDERRGGHPPPPVGATAARAQIEAGQAAIAAGAIDSGLACLRQACLYAERCGDTYLAARARLALGGALIHTRQQHSEAAVVLHQAADAARRIGATAVAATAYRELAFVDVQAGRRDRAAAWLTHAAHAADGADEELASIAGVRGMNHSDAGHYRDALACLEESVECAERCGHGRQVAWSRSLIGRVHLLTGQTTAARAALERSLELVEQERWIAFSPWPEALLAHLDLCEGRQKAAGDALEHAFTIACQIGDACWEGVVSRGLGQLEAARGRTAEALTWLADARRRCTRVDSPYQWVHAWILDALCDAVPDDEQAASWIARLESLAASTAMREFVARAYQHRARRGDTAAIEAARHLAADIDLPGATDGARM
jgi:DNA-binding SARP family transcriptional activator